MGKVEDVLRKNGPMLSGELAERLSEHYKMTNDAARKAISRATRPVQKIKAFPFNKNQVFCYLEEQFNSEAYRERLYNSLKTSAESFSIVLQAMENMNNVIDRSLLPIYSKSPVQSTVGHWRFDRIIERLIKYGIAYELDDKYIAITDAYSNGLNEHNKSKAKEQIIKIVVSDFVDWARKINLISFGSAKIYPKEAVFAHFKWGATVPSYVSPMYDFKKHVNGFVVVDYLPSINATVEDVRFFVEKVSIIRAFKNAYNFMPVLLINGTTVEAMQFLKENKIVVL